MTSRWRISERAIALPQCCLIVLLAGTGLLRFPPMVATGGESADPVSVTVTEDQNGKEIQVDEGGTLVVRLKAHLGTGASWYIVKNDSDLLKPVSERPRVEGIPGPDGPGQFEVFEFSAQKRGTGELEFIWRRPFKDDPDAPKDKPKKIFQISVAVGGHQSGK